MSKKAAKAMKVAKHAPRKPAPSVTKKNAAKATTPSAKKERVAGHAQLVKELGDLWQDIAKTSKEMRAAMKELRNAGAVLSAAERKLFRALAKDWSKNAQAFKKLADHKGK